MNAAGRVLQRSGSVAHSCTFVVIVTVVIVSITLIIISMTISQTAKILKLTAFKNINISFSRRCVMCAERRGGGL